MISHLLITLKRSQIDRYLKENFKFDYFLIEVKPKEKEYSIEDVRYVTKESSFYFEKIRVYLFENFHLSSLPAQNAFLKILEEPPKNVVFVLSTDNPHKILPTIISRLKVVNLKDEKVKELAADKEKLITEFLKKEKIDFSLAEKVSLDELILFFRKRLKDDKKNSLILKEILKVRSLMETNNLNSTLAFDHLLIFIKKANS